MNPDSSRLQTCPPLFVYGSLMYDAVWGRLVSSPCRSAPATLHGWRRLSVRGQPYPGLRPGEGKVQGVVRLDLQPEAFARLDTFEGQQYRRQTVRLELGAGGELSAECYVFKPEYWERLEEREWDPAEFERTGLARFLDGYAGFGDR